MKQAPRYLGPAGGELARERLGEYERYAELVAEQEAALDTGDFERFEELAVQVAATRSRIGAPDDTGQDADSDSEDVVEVLQRALAANRRIQDRLAGLRQEHAGRIRNVQARRPQARRYVAESAEEPAGHLDVTL